VTMAGPKKVLLFFEIQLCLGLVCGSTLKILPHPKGGVPLPTLQQLKYGGKINALIHFEMATFFHDGDPGCDAQNWLGCDPGVGGACNSSDVRSFNPTNLNISSWIEMMNVIGADSAVITAKHGCGFLLWDTNVTLPDGSPYR
jgi:alpha-L-fucosidase